MAVAVFFTSSDIFYFVGNIFRARSKILPDEVKLLLHLFRVRVKLCVGELSQNHRKRWKTHTSSSIPLKNFACGGLVKRTIIMNYFKGKLTTNIPIFTVRRAAIFVEPFSPPEGRRKMLLRAKIKSKTLDSGFTTHLKTSRTDK